MNERTRNRKSSATQQLLSHPEIRWGLNLVDTPVEDAEFDFSQPSGVGKTILLHLSGETGLGPIEKASQSSDQIRLWRSERDELETSKKQSEQELINLEHEIESLSSRLHSVRRQFASQKADTDSKLAAFRSEREATKRQFAECRGQLLSLKEELGKAEQNIRGTSDYSDRLCNRLNQLDRRIRKLRSRQQTVRLELLETRKALASGVADTPHDSDFGLADARDQLIRLEQSAEALVEHFGNVSYASKSTTQTADRNARFDEFKNNLETTYPSLFHVHSILSKRLNELDRQNTEWKLQTLRRRHKDYGKCIQRLLRKRADLLKQLAELGLDIDWLVERSQYGHCYCAPDESVSDTSFDSNWTGSRSIQANGLQIRELGRQIDSKQAELDQLAERFRELTHQINQLEAIRGEGAFESPETLEQTIRAKRNSFIRCQEVIHQLATSIRELDRRIDQPIERLRSWSLEKIRIASRYFAKLGDSYWDQLYLDWESFCIEAVDHRNQHVAIESLEPIERDMAYLAISIALLPELGEALEHCIWNVALDRLRYDQALAVAEVLHAECPEDLCLLVTTGLGRLADRLRLSGQHVISLNHEESSEPEPSPISQPVIDLSDSYVPNTSSLIFRQNNSDAEEFPGEFRDQVARTHTSNWNLSDVDWENSIEAYSTQPREALQSFDDEDLLNQQDWLSHDVDADHLRRAWPLQDQVDVGNSDESQSLDQRDIVSRSRATRPFPVQWSRTDLPHDIRESNGPDNTTTQMSGTKVRHHHFGGSSRMTRDSSIRSLQIFDDISIDSLEADGVFLIRDLIDRSPQSISDCLPIQFQSVELVANWQRQAQLRCEFPKLSSFDAKVLAACQVGSREQLDALEKFELADRIDALRQTESGQALLLEGSDSELARLDAWVSNMREARPLKEYGYFDAATPNDLDGGDNQNRPAPVRRAEPENDRSQPSSKSNQSTTPSPKKSSAKPRTTRSNEILKFHLNLDDEVEAAPEIGPRMAEHLGGVGVRTVRDLLKEDSVELATRLDHRRVKPATVYNWQKQAMLVCRVPNLRGHDAQLLVACGIESPEQLAECTPEQLFDLVGPFAESKDGQKIIRNGKKPDLEEIHDWVRWSQNHRNLMAA